MPSRAAAAPNWEGEMRGDPWPIFTTLTLAPDAPTGTLDLNGQKLELTDVIWSGERLTANAKGSRGPIPIEAMRTDDRLIGTLRGQTERPFELRAFVLPKAAANRLEAWRQDVDALATRFAAADRSFSPDARVRFQEALRSLRREIPRLNDNQIIARMAAAIALADNAHTRLYLLRNRTALRRLPIRLWWFGDDLRIVRAPRDQAGFLGCRVTAIGGVDAATAKRRVAPLFAGNASWQTYKSSYSLSSPDALQGVGVITDADRVKLTLADCPAAGQVTMATPALVPSDKAVEAWWDLSPLKAATGDWVQALDDKRASLPLHLRQPDHNYWYEALSGTNALYVNYSRSQEDATETTAAFADRVLAEVARTKPSALILDLRFNTGGNLELGRDMMQRLEQATRGIPRYIITGRATFSAGITHLASWREAGNVTIVGEPAGDRLDMWAEGGNIRLPNSGLDAHFANAAHSYSPTPCPPDVACLDMASPDIAPDIPLTERWADYRAGRDVALEAIMADLARRGS
ncbi:hypothetical protein [Allosphingosinicella indica]|nr:hypothetical protein [Allosphingosinicella indica]